MSYRIRVNETGQLVLQVYEPPRTGPYTYGDEGKWRDAKVEDIPITDPFTRQALQEGSYPQWNGKT